MTPSEHFMRHVAECEFMSEIALDKDSKTAWIGMAERWRRCAELARQQDETTHDRHARRRKPDRSSSH